MNTFFVIAALLCVVGGFLHSILGERLILTKLSRDALPKTIGSQEFVLQVLRLFWHMVSIAWWGFAVLLWILVSVGAFEASRQIALVIAATFFVSAVVSLFVSRGKHFSWPVLLAIAILTMIGAA